MFNNVHIVPKPKVLNTTNHYISLPQTITFGIIPERVKNYFIKIFPFSSMTENNPLFLFLENNNGVYSSNTSKEWYQLDITDYQIQIIANAEVGFFYALQTINDILVDGELPCVHIEDYPDLEIRGVMLDISRSKVPKLDTLYSLIDLFANLKLNHLELYVEGFSFGYESFKELLDANNYISLEDYLLVEKYANDNFIDFVPNQNGLGHMADWLAVPKYKHLAECKDGFTIWGAHRNPSTLNPLDEESLQLVKTMYQDMLPHTKSSYFNMNLDEPYEIGTGKSKEKALETSKEDVYLDYVRLLTNEVRRYKKRPMMWGDVIVHHPDVVEKMDEDVILIDWGYSKNYPFLDHAKMLDEINRPYLLAAGTSTWATIVGRYDDMCGSIINAATSAKNNHGLGCLVTDWGDMGHLQYLPASYAGFILAGMSFWGEINLELLEERLTYIVGNVNANALIALSKFTNFEGEYRDYGSRLFTTIMWAEHSSRLPKEEQLAFFDERMKFNYLDNDNAENIKDLLTKTECEVKSQLQIEKDNLVSKEILNSIFLLKILLSINQKLKNNCTDFHVELDELEQYSAQHLVLWKARNIEEGYSFSNKRIEWLQEVLVQKQLKGDNYE